MKMNTDIDWLRRRSAQEDDFTVSVGGFVSSLEQKAETQAVVPIQHAFVRFIELERRKRRLSLEQFAERVDVDLSEMFKIVSEERYKPAIRSVHKIAEFLKLPEKKLLALAGLLQMQDQEFQTAALKFAARSAPVETLTKQEHADLEEIVKVLCQP